MDPSAGSSLFVYFFFPFFPVNLPLIDLTFALSSSSISSQQTFKLMKETVQSLVHTYGIDRIHYGVIVFGSVVTRHFDFSTTIPDQNEVIRKVSLLTRSGGSPDLVLALQEARRVFQLKEVRPYAKKVLVVMIDDESSADKNDLNEEVRALRNRSVLVIGVGIGTRTLPKDLGIITDDKRNTIQAGINKNKDELAREIISIILRRKYNMYQKIDGTRQSHSAHKEHLPFLAAGRVLFCLDDFLLGHSLKANSHMHLYLVTFLLHMKVSYNG